ncbi:MAG: hypothetical protein ACR2NR_09220 [Solirubrobacteraceae bacterium]
MPPLLASRTISRRSTRWSSYLRQVSPLGPETLSFAANRDAANRDAAIRGHAYPPLWPADQSSFTAGGK